MSAHDRKARRRRYAGKACVLGWDHAGRYRPLTSHEERLHTRAFHRAQVARPLAEIRRHCPAAVFAYIGGGGYAWTATPERGWWRPTYEVTVPHVGVFKSRKPNRALKLALRAIRAQIAAHAQDPFAAPDWVYAAERAR